MSRQQKRWVEDHFYLTLQISLAYVFVVFGTKYLMRNRQPFGLFVPLNLWNFLLAVFSIVGTIKLTPEFFSTVYNQGFQESYCHVRNFTSGENGYWVWLFIVSKMFELLDTVFLVLRKRPLMFLHWYHHILTMVYAFFSFPLTPGFNRWGIYLNFFVHAFMYSYYFLRSMKIHVPGVIAKFVTTIQIWQFIISVGVLVHLAILIYLQNVCLIHEDVVQMRRPNCLPGQLANGEETRCSQQLSKTEPFVKQRFSSSTGRHGGLLFFSVELSSVLFLNVYRLSVQCDFNPRIFVLATFMDVTYLILFINFFLQSYVFNGGKAKYQKPAEKNGKANGVHHQNGVKANGDSKKHE
ncbi:Elongation of very long chain fatty acids protein [Aphelenchoides bicaudatus]|nr:Elongation of very long chain fatty acids protein [Aphelenchoides bicaudatus]